MQERAQRAIRGSVLGSVALVAAASSHALAGGPVPGWLGVAVGAVFACVLGTVLVSRRPSLPRTAVIVAASQAAFHYLFVGLGGPGLVVAAHAHGASAPLHLTGHTSHFTDPPMLVAHAVAAAVTLLVLHRAEGALWRMLRGLLMAVRRAFEAPVTSPAPSRATAAARLDRGRTPIAARRVAVAPLRGPPSALSA